MLLRLCQLKSLLLLSLILSSCTLGREKKTDNPVLISMHTPKWFTANIQHGLWSARGNDDKGEPLPHLFFDVNPEFSENDHSVNVVISTPENSSHHYKLNMSSGQRYFTHTYCKQIDIWNEVSGTFGRPPYSVGYIPRLLDQLGEPQKVIIWGSGKKMRETLNYHFHRVRLIGGYVEQSCPEGNCHGKSNWLSRIVYIAFDPEDIRFKEVSDLEAFKKMIHWKDMKAYLQNIDGRNKIGASSFPATRIGELIPFKEVFDYGKKRSILMTDPEIKKIQNGCHALYDRLWSEVGEEREEDRAATTTDALKKKLKLIEELKKQKKLVGHAKRFQAFTRKYYDELKTCGKFVYPGNINVNSEKFWFLSFVDIFYKLHDDGYFFDCEARAWRENLLDVTGKPIHEIKKDIVRCDEKDIDQAMGYLPNFMMGIKNTSAKGYWRFVDYDTRSYGSHQKIYSWVKMPSKKFDCTSEVNESIIKDMKVTPDEVRWKNWDVTDIESDTKIIY